MKTRNAAWRALGGDHILTGLPFVALTHQPRSLVCGSLFPLATGGIWIGLLFFLMCAMGVGSAFAADLTTVSVVPTGSDWSSAVWRTNAPGFYTNTINAPAPVAGNTNTYECIFNGTRIGNNLGETRLRNPVTNGTPSILEFPGASLTLDTNTELRLKYASVNGGVGSPTCSFSGLNGNPGLVLNGGFLNVGDSAIFVVTGRVAALSLSYLCPSSSDFGGVSAVEGLNVGAILSGDAPLVVLQGTTNTPVTISGTENTFSGPWFVKAGRLLGAGANSLGTNSITIDPLWPIPPGFDPSATNAANGPAALEVNYNIDSAGALTLTNGGTMTLHQDCFFAAAIVEGTALMAGYHPYSELTNLFPTNFLPGGSGSITVQPFGIPTLVAQPISTIALQGSLIQLSVTAAGAGPLVYQWQRSANGAFAPLSNGGDVTGANSNVLTFAALALPDGASYQLVVSNAYGTVTSQVATVTVIAPLEVAAESPAAGATLTNLTQIQIAFDRIVEGVDASYLLVNGVPCNTVSPATGSAEIYLFTFAQPQAGAVAITWAPNTAISDQGGNPFDPTGSGDSWGYTLLDVVAPTVAALTPVAGITVASLTQIAVTFSKPVVGVEAQDLSINGKPATGVTGSGAGPYVFQFPQPASGTVQFAWSAATKITDTASPPNRFAGGSWTNVLNPQAGPAMVRINEFLAANVSTNGLRDQFGNLQSWIELYNFGSNSVNLTGYSLTDDPTLPAKWVFPAITLGAGQFLVVFASGLNLTNPASPLHTSFTLGRSGDYLALFNAQSPPVALTQFSPQYPEQRNDISYGYDSSNQLEYFAVPTPGAPNGNSTISGAVADINFTVQRGFFDQPCQLILTTETPGATIRYTTDGSQPTETTTGITFSQPLVIDQLTTLRAAAFCTNLLPTLVQTETYIFLTNVLNQPANPPGFPITTDWSINDWPSEYGMNPMVVTNALYSSEITSDFLAIPTLSIVLNTSDMFGPTGIYHNYDPLTVRPEVGCSAELINPDGSPGFQIDCGIRIHGGGSASRPMKHPFDLSFQSKFGAGKLKYQFFPDSPVKEFSGTFVLRADYNNSWVHALTPYGSASISQRARGGLVRDPFCKDIQTAMGDLSSHSRYVHLYINGLYWGVYNPCEQIDQDFGAEYLGGNSSDYDEIEGSDSTLAITGQPTAYNTMLSYNTPALAGLSQYNQIKQYLDVTQYIDYLLIQFYGADQDWGTEQNFIAIRNRNVPGSLFEFLCWDSERTFENIDDTPLGSPLNSVSPGNLQANLVLNAEYRLLFADRVYKHMFNNGVLVSTNMVGAWMARSSQIEGPMVCESARWGNSVPGGKLSMSPLPYPSYTTTVPYYSRNEDFLGEQGRLLTNYFPFRNAVFLSQLRDASLYPSIDAPIFSQFGGNVPPGFNLAISATAGAIYYTTNGTDPRLYGSGAVSAQAAIYNGPLTLNESSVIQARARSGTTWSALAEASFTVASLGVPLAITEIMYDPPGGEAFQYINIQNIGATPLNVSGFSFDGVKYIFPSGSIIQPGAVVLLASDDSPSAFATAYPGAKVYGYFGGSIALGGDRIAILDANGRTVTAVTYNNAAGWPPAAAGEGYSLEVIDPRGDPNSPANWSASSSPGGTPGQPPAPPQPGSVVINEIMAANATAVENGNNYPDWLELYNGATNSVSLGNWSLSNSGKARKFIFPPDVILAAGGYLVVWCDTHTNDPGLHTLFALSKHGDNVFLYDANTNRVDAVAWGEQITDLSIGRVNGAWQLTLAVTNGPNAPATLAATTNVSINEWLANSGTAGTNWIELFNRSSNAPAALQGLYLTTSNSLFQTRALSFLPPLGFLQLFASQLPGPTNLDITINSSGDTITLDDPTGEQIDSVTFGPRPLGISEGRLPDGSPNIVSFPGTASPGAPNYVSAYSGPVLNELMASNVSTLRDQAGNYAGWVELYNPNTFVWPLMGMSLGPNQSGSGQWVFPPGAAIAPNGYLLVWFDPSQPASTSLVPSLNTGFSLSGDGGSVYLLDTNNQVADSVAFGFQPADMAIGRSAGTWALLASPTPGAANTTAAVLGSTSNLRINEWMANPASGNTWFELYNAGASPALLAGLYLTDDPSIAGITKSQVSSLSYIAGGGFVLLQADGNPGAGPNHVNFSLNPDGDTIWLSGADLSFIDSVEFGLQSAGVSQGRLPNGSTNIASFPGTPTPGAGNYVLTILGEVDSDGDGMGDSWKTQYDLASVSAIGESGPNADPDGDGFSNLQEYIAGTDPLDPASYLKIGAIVENPGGTVLQFTAVAGRSYTIQYCGDLTAGAWQKLADVNASATTGTASVVDPSAQGTCRFYKLVTPKLP